MKLTALEEYAKLRPDADRWRRAVRSCLADPDANGDPAAAVECVSHLALHDAEAEIARLREALNIAVYFLVLLTTPAAPHP